MKSIKNFNQIITELQNGEKIVIYDSQDDIALLFSASEMIETSTVVEHKTLSSSQPSILLSANRCQSIGIKTNKNCSCIIDEAWTKNDILNITFSKKEDLNIELNGLIQENSDIFKFPIELLKKSKLLPSAIVSIILNNNINDIKTWAQSKNLLSIDINQLKLKFEEENNSLEILVKAHIPIKKTNDCEFVLFKSNRFNSDFFCLFIGKARRLLKNSNLDFIPTIRIHSQCVTGDLLSSLKCDCGQQLQMSIQHMVDNDEGILIYLSQEGRDIGLINKLRSYNLQEKGLDTVDANKVLGFEEDERKYDVAVDILNYFNLKEVNIITNNPKKIEYLNKNKIKTNSRVASVVKANPYNRKYLKTKKTKSGHYI